jgi:outer membrane biosynthesis protein TonB
MNATRSFVRKKDLSFIVWLCHFGRKEEEGGKSMGTDDNRMDNAFGKLSEGQKKAAKKEWGSVRAWYLCQHTSTIYTGIRDGFDPNLLAEHYDIPIKSVLVVKDSLKQWEKKLLEEKRTESSPQTKRTTVQGPIQIDVPPAVQKKAKTKKAKSVPVQTEAPEKKKRGRKPAKKQGQVKEKPVVVAESPNKVGAKASTVDTDSLLHPNARTTPQPKKSKPLTEEEAQSLIHPGARVGRKPPRDPSKAIPKDQEGAQSYSVFVGR